MLFIILLLILLWLLIGLSAWYYEIFKGPRSSLRIEIGDVLLGLPITVLSGPISWLLLSFHEIWN